MPRMVTLLLVGILLTTVGCARPWLFQRADRHRPDPRIGKAAPNFDAEDFDGRHVNLSDYRGKVVALVFWATWCKPCTQMIPHERDLASRLHDKPFALISVNVDEEHDEARKVIAREHMTWTQIKSGNDSLSNAYEVKAYPAVYVIDRNGVLRAAGSHLRGEILERTVTALLAEK